MKIFLFHCWGGDGNSCWSGWLSNILTKLGTQVISPDFPNSSDPNLKEWLDAISKNTNFQEFDSDWILAGHSLGCPTILRVLERLEEGKKVKAAILVAGFAKDIGIPQLKSFIDTPFDWNKIRKSAEKIIVINSDDDPFIELSEGKRMADLLGAEFIIEHNAGHINEGSGFGPYPRLLRIIQEMEQ